MNRPFRDTCVWLTVLMLLVTAARRAASIPSTSKGDLAHYKDVATELEAPDVGPGGSDPYVGRPFTLEQFDQSEPWPMTLQEAIQQTLARSEILRKLPATPQLAGVQSASVTGPSTQLLSQPESVATVYDPAIQAANPLGGVEAALSAFDAQFNTSMFWGHNERPQNIGGFGQFIFAQDFQRDSGTFQAELAKRNATGGQVFARNNVVYDGNNNPTRGALSDYTVDYEIGVNQPLLRGAGTMFNRIAGPGAQPGVYNGVLIARINNDISLADFEANVRNLVADVETAYWELYVAYRVLDSNRQGRESALKIWRQVMELYEADVEGGEAERRANALSEYYRFDGDLKDAACQLLRAENRLRFLLGEPPNDGRLIRPVDEPIMAKVLFDWEQIHLEALARSTEVRKQKWRIKQRELELCASRNFLLPQLDAVALYRWLGAGDRLIDPNGRGVPPYAGSNAFSTLTGGDFQEWQLGFELSVPIGYRRELSAVRHAQLQLVRDRARLHDQELAVSHLLTEAYRGLDCNYELLQVRYNNWEAAKQLVDALEAKQRQGVQMPYRDLPDAVRTRAEAETAFFRVLVNYNRSIVDVHFRKGSLLEYNGVYLAEGPWPAKAYCDADRKAADRCRGHEMDYCMRPRQSILSVGPVTQFADGVTEGEPLSEYGPPLEEVPSPRELLPEMPAPAEPPPADPPAPDDDEASGAPGRTPVMHQADRGRSRRKPLLRDHRALGTISWHGPVRAPSRGCS